MKELGNMQESEKDKGRFLHFASVEKFFFMKENGNRIDTFRVMDYTESKRKNSLCREDINGQSKTVI